MKKVDEIASEPSGDELAVRADMEAELPGEGKNGDFALTVACLALLTCRGGRGEDGTTTGLMEAAMMWWSGR